jgi:hypothetical protein
MYTSNTQQSDEGNVSEISCIFLTVFESIRNFTLEFLLLVRNDFKNKIIGSINATTA